MKVAINTNHGMFSVSKKACDYLGCGPYDYTDGDRSDPLLIKCIEELGEKANGVYAKLKIVEIPDDISWHIESYDGNERVTEDHRTWE